MSALIAPLVILLIFATALVGWDRLGFRDVGHFYTPLYDYVGWRTSESWLPLWNPLDQTGMPLLGETTTAVLYPIRYLLFSLPVSTETAISWYVVLHLILASMNAATAARWAAVSTLAANGAAIVYPLCGSILFLYTNPTFLVGAAWLPLVMGAMLARAPLTIRTRILVAGPSMSMMILGGDPQTALHAMVALAVIWAVRLVGRRPGAGLPAVALIAVPALAAALAAPQVLASISWSSQSDRLSRREQEDWMEPPVIGGQRYDAFEFSLPPWHAVELATPNAFGSLLPTNRRLSRLIPGDGRTWTPSVYMGVLVLVVLLCRLVNWRAAAATDSRIWTCMAVLGFWLALGGFGLVWLIQATTGRLGGLDSSIGGGYWFLYQFLPGYDSFRYPAKWLTFFSLGAAITTAQWLEHPTAHRTSTRILTLLALIFGIALIAVVALRYNPAIVINPGDKLPSDEFWGPLDVDGALAQTSYSLVHSLFALAAISLILRFADRQGPLRTEESAINSRRSRTTWMLLVVTAIDLGVFGYGLIARVPRQVETELVKQITAYGPATADRWMRTQTAEGWPHVWRETRDDQRLVEVEASLRAAWFGRWHLADKVAVLNNMVSIRSRSMSRFWHAARHATAGMSADQRAQFWSAVRRWLSIEAVVHTSNQSVEVELQDWTAHLVHHVQHVENSYPVLRSHSDWQHRQPGGNDADDLVHCLREVWRTGGNVVPVVQAEPDANVRPETSVVPAAVKVIGADAEQMEVKLQLQAATLLTRPVFQDGHWTAEYAPLDFEPARPTDWRPLVVHRVDHLSQGVLLPAGDWLLRFRYSPWWLIWSLAIAASAWTSLAAIAGWCLWQRRMLAAK